MKSYCFLYAKLNQNCFKDFNSREYENVLVDVNMFLGKRRILKLFAIVCHQKQYKYKNVIL